MNAYSNITWPGCDTPAVSLQPMCQAPQLRSQLLLDDAFSDMSSQVLSLHNTGLYACMQACITDGPILGCWEASVRQHSAAELLLSWVLEECHVGSC